MFILFTLLLDNTVSRVLTKEKPSWNLDQASTHLSRDLLPAISESRKKVNFQKPILNWVKQFSHFGIYCLTPCNSKIFRAIILLCQRQSEYCWIIPQVEVERNIQQWSTRLRQIIVLVCTVIANPKLSNYVVNSVNKENIVHIFI